MSEDAETAANLLVQANLRPAAVYAATVYATTVYAGRELDLPALIRAARLGLMRAAHRFDSRRGLRFLPCAKPFIEEAVRGPIHRSSCEVERTLSQPICRRVN